MLTNTKAFPSFSVNDLQKAQDFYSKTLGINVTKAPVEEAALHLNLDGNKVFVYQKDNHVPATFTILNFPVANIEQTVDELTKKGIQFEHYGGELETNAQGIHEEHGGKIAWFKDPAGNYLSVIEGEM